METLARPPAGSPPRCAGSVGFAEKLALGAGGLPVYLGLAAVAALATPYYQMTLKVSPTLLGAALTVPRFLDAFIDPLVGRFSDNFHSRFGRRRPLIAFGALVQALAFGLIWMVPTGWSQYGLAAWLVASQIVFYVGYAFFSVPFAALQYEITPDYDERTRVSSFVGFFGKVGEMGNNYFFAIASSALFVSVSVGVRSVGWVIGCVLLGVVAAIPAFFVRERFFHRAEQQEKVRLLPGIAAAFRSRAFVILVGLTLLQIVAGMFASSLDYYLIVYSIFGGDVPGGSVWKGNLSMGYAIVGILSIYPVAWLAQRIGKTRTVVIAFVLTFFGAIGKWLFFTPGSPWRILLDPLLCGPVWIAINILTPAMLADICDEDELRGGMRREGLFGAIFSWIQKVGYSTAAFGASVSLQMTGFDAALGGAQPPDTIFRIRLILALSTAVWAVLAIILLRLYPLSRQRAHEIRGPRGAPRGRTASRGVSQCRGPRTHLNSFAPMSAKSSPSAKTPAPPRKRATIYDLARVAGVSAGTVSRVLNNRDKVKDETRDRVLRAAKELNLKPQVSVRSRQIAILTEPGYTDRVEGYAATLAAHLAFAFSRRNIGVFLPSNPVEQLPGMFLDGIVAVTADKHLQTLLTDLEKRIPVVHMDKFDCTPSEYAVCSDHFNSGYLAAKHLIERGRRRLAFFGGDYRPFAERLAGFRKAMTEAGVPIDERLTGLFGPESTHLAVLTRIVRSGADAIYAPGSSFQALECLHLLTYTMRVKVPQEISLIGGENEGISVLQTPPLTTIAEPLREMAERAVEMVDRLTSGETVTERRVTLPVRLIERDSVA